MESSKIIKIFINKGFQLDKKALDYLNSNPDKINNLLTRLESMEQKPFIVNLDVVQSAEANTGVSVIKKFGEGRKPKSIQEVTQFFLNRYQKINELFSNRFELINLISINKITDRTRKFSVVGLVREKSESDNSILVEDFTGETTLIFSDDDKRFDEVNMDDVLGFICENDNGTNSVKNIVYPDVPVKKEVSHTNQNITCYFFPDMHTDSENFDEERYKLMMNEVHSNSGTKIIFVLGGVSRNKEQISKVISDLPKDASKVIVVSPEDADFEIGSDTLKVGDPCVVGIDAVKIFVSHGNLFEKYVNDSDKPPAETLLGLVRKRHLNPSFEPNKKIYDEDPYFLDTIPDIFAIGHFHKPGLVNYKGITVLSTGSLNENPIFWKINLRTRENLKIDLT